MEELFDSQMKGHGMFCGNWREAFEVLSWKYRSSSSLLLGCVNDDHL